MPPRADRHGTAGRPRAVVAAAPASAGRGAAPSNACSSLRCLLAAAAYGGHLGYDWWTDGRFLVGTDDAYVQGDITLLAANAEGYVRFGRGHQQPGRCAPAT